MLTETQLLNLKKDIETSKTLVSELNGKLSMLHKQLKDDFGCSSLEEAKKKLSEWKEEIEDLDTKIKEQCDELEERYKF
jgi:uncharacterized coiled-coil DUF342 family protein